MPNQLSYDEAKAIDSRWVASGMNGGLRIVRYRISGNRTRTFLTEPGNDEAPCYCYDPNTHSFILEA